MLLQQSKAKSCHEAFEILQAMHSSQIIRILNYTPVWLLTLQKYVWIHLINVNVKETYHVFDISLYRIKKHSI